VIRTRASDIYNLGIIYACKDVYESKLLTDEEYDGLPERHSERAVPNEIKSKLDYHNKLYSFLDTNRDSPSFPNLLEYRSFHRTMQARLIRNNPMYQNTYPTIESFRLYGEYNNRTE
tara:strand:+ start:361 stop:711 length:351 start_codon:yes stop_codon:yes gene_type:complete